MNIAIKQPGEKKPEKTIPSFHSGTTTVSRYLLDKLLNLGVRHIFGVPGDYVLNLNRRIEEHPITFVNTTREHTAGYMADAYARLQGLGVACVTYGVGLSICNAIAQAYAESCAVVVISGSPGAKEFADCPQLHHLINKSRSQRRDRTQWEIFSQLTAAQAFLNDPHTAAAEIDRVIEVCIRQQKPVYIELPRDCVDEPIAEHRYTPTSLPLGEEASLQKAMAAIGTVLKSSRRPFIWLGHEVQRHHLLQPVLEFAEKLRIPIVSTLLGKGTISEYHPLYAGIYQGELSRDEVGRFVDECDCAILIGVLLDDVSTGLMSAKLGHKHRIIIDENLIEADGTAYSNILWREVVKGLPGIALPSPFTHTYPANIDRPPSPFRAIKGTPLSAESLYLCIERHLQHDQLIVSDIGDALFGTTDLTVEQDCYLSSAYYATVGFAIPGAIAAQLYYPKKQVIAVVGDGAFQMTGTELSTAVRYGLDPLVIILNNHGYSMERPIVEGNFNDLVNWNYSKITELLGSGYGIKVSTEDEFEDAYLHALSHRGKLRVIEVPLDKADVSEGMRRFAELIKRKKKP